MLPRDIIDHIAAFVGVLDLDGTVIEVNEATLQISGAKRNDITGCKLWECFFFAYDASVADTVRRAVDRAVRGETTRFDTVGCTATGRLVAVDLMIQPVRDETGRIARLIPSGIDISERKQVEDQLRRSLDLLERAQRIGRLGHWSYNIPAAKLSWSGEARRIFVRDAHVEPTWDLIKPLIHPDDLERLRKEAREAIASGNRFVSSYRIRRDDGEERFLEVEAEPDYDADGRPQRIFGVVRDLTDARLREHRILEQQQLIDLSLEPIFCWDLGDGLSHWNPGCEQLYGYSKEEALGRFPYELLSSQFPAACPEVIELLRAGHSWTGEVVQTTRSGQHVTVEARIDPTQAGDRKLVLEAHRDVTARRDAEEQLKLSQQRLAIATELAGVGFFDHDQIEDAIHFSREPWTGVLPQEASLEDVIAAIHPADRAAFREAVAKAHDPAGTGHFEYEYRLVRKTGEVRWMSVKSRTFFEGEGKDRRAVRTMGAVIDVTDRRMWEEQQNLLMGELNHRIRNTLSVVQSIATQTLRSAKDPKTFVEAFKGRIQAIASAHKLLNETTWQGTHLSDLVREQLPSAGGAGPITADGPEVWLPPEVTLNLGLVLHELGTNAREYGALSLPSGRVEISWTVRKVDDKLVLHLSWRERGGPPVRPPQARGFGMGLIERIMGGTVAGETSVRFEAEGLHCVIDLELQSTSPPQVPAV